MSVKRTTENELIVGLVSISDRASAGIYRDEGIPALEAWLTTPSQRLSPFISASSPMSAT